MGTELGWINDGVNVEVGVAGCCCICGDTRLIITMGEEADRSAGRDCNTVTAVRAGDGGTEGPSCTSRLNPGIHLNIRVRFDASRVVQPDHACHGRVLVTGVGLPGGSVVSLLQAAVPRAAVMITARMTATTRTFMMRLLLGCLVGSSGAGAVRPAGGRTERTHRSCARYRSPGSRRLPDAWLFPWDGRSRSVIQF